MTATARAGAACVHCGLALEDSSERFCCSGCATAYAIIRGAGLESYYRERASPAPRPEAATVGWSAVPSTAGPDGTREIRLQVDGLRCASCVWVVEQVLERTVGVTHAEVSYATGRAHVRWNPGRIDLPAIAGRIAQLGYRPRAIGVETSPDRDTLARLGVALFAAFWLMAAYEAQYAGRWFLVDPRWAAFFRWLALAIATPVALWSAAPFFAGAVAGLRQRVVPMDLPIALGIATLYLHGLVQTVRGGEAYLDSLGMLVAALLAGRLLEGRGRRRAVDAATALAATAPRTARRVRDGRLDTVPAEELVPGDEVDIGAGEEIAADGVVVEGAGQVRMALLTGEALPVAVLPGDRVVAGTVLVDGALTLRVEADGRETLLARMAAELERAADRGGRAEAVDRVAPWFTVGTLLAAALTFAGWMLAGNPALAFTASIAVLIVACPCALALSRPLAAAAGLGAAARRGILFRNADSLLELEHTRHVVLDKTGTITEGHLAVVEADDATLRIAAGLERYSVHPVGRAIVAAVMARGLALPRGTDVREEPGVGISGRVNGKWWEIRTQTGPGMSVRLAADDGSSAVIRLGDEVRDDAARAVHFLRQDGVEVTLLTGDRLEVAGRVARTVGIRRVLASVGPEEKARWIAARRAAGERLLFAGDGVNDGPALAQADIGVAMGTGAASSVLVADAVIARPGLMPLVAARRAARACRRAIRFNYRWSVAYNIGAVAAAALGLVGPLACAILMPLSSAVVVWGASRVEGAVHRDEAAA